MKTRLGMEFFIDYAHYLPSHPVCGYKHGHTAKVIVELEGTIKGGESYQDNMIIDFADMKNTCKSILSQLDHKDLNGMFGFPSVENISKWLFEELGKKLPVIKITFYEGNGKWCTVEK